MIGVLASGSGSNLQALIDADLGAPISVVVANVPGAKALERAEKAGIPAVLVDHKAFPDRASFDRALVDVLVAHRVEWVVLAGFMRIVTKVVLDAFPDRVVNIHPALLPSFPGVDAQKRAFDAGVKITGCTVHLVDEGTDTGPILAQAAVPVLATDDALALKQRILRQEHRLFPAVVRALVAGGLTITTSADGRRRARLDGVGDRAEATLVCPALLPGSREG
ncbi:phosphoribosylglycinamide formyltransferase [Myxococcota bacterium]|nr:phosphoribosylglycinamide formyltransferase [Myxococcota bacterium]